LALPSAVGRHRLAPHRRDDLLRRHAQHVEDRSRVEADPEGEDDQGHERQLLARRQVRQVLVGRVGEVPEEDPLVQPEEVRGAEDDPGAGVERPPEVLREGALEDRELADEPVQDRQAHRR
jgi:hypothetical protein